MKSFETYAEWVVLRIEGELDAERCVELDAALAADPELARFSEEQQRLGAALDGLGVEPVEPADVERLGARVRNELGGVERSAAASGASPPSGAGAVLRWAAAALLVGAVGFGLKATFGTRGEPTRRQQPPAVAGGRGPAVEAEAEAVAGSPSAGPPTPLGLLAQAGRGHLDGGLPAAAELEAVRQSLAELGPTGMALRELCEEVLRGDDPHGARAAAALLADDGGPLALRALESGLLTEGRAELAAAGLARCGRRGFDVLRRRFGTEALQPEIAAALVRGGVEELGLVLDELERRPASEWAEALRASLWSANPTVLVELAQQRGPSAELLACFGEVRPEAAVGLLGEWAGRGSDARAALDVLMGYATPAAALEVLQRVELGRIERDDVALALEDAQHAVPAWNGLAGELARDGDRRWRAALLDLLVEQTALGLEPGLLALADAEDLPGDLRLLGVLACAPRVPTSLGTGADPARAELALAAFLGGVERDEARLAAAALAVLAQRIGATAACVQVGLDGAPTRLLAALDPFLINAGARAAFAASDLSRLARALEPLLPLQPSTES